VEIFSWAAIVGLLTAVVFMLWPKIDLDLSAWFNIAPRVFLFDRHIAPLAVGIQGAASILTWLAIVAAAVGIGMAIVRKRHLLGLGLSHWVFLSLVLILGPAVLVNNVLKEHSGRPRPMHLEQFGGPSSFTPVFHSGDCARNCSFVSGEAASIYALGFAVALLARRRRVAVLIATVLAGSFVGFIRIAQGAHFLSDIVFAGVFMAIVAVIIHWFVFDVAAPRLEVSQRGRDERSD
jgi:lipid A 4'-phosphatase